MATKKDNSNANTTAVWTVLDRGISRASDAIQSVVACSGASLQKNPIERSGRLFGKQNAASRVALVKTRPIR